MLGRWPVYRLLLLVMIGVAAAAMLLLIVQFGQETPFIDGFLITALLALITAAVFMLRGLWSFDRQMEKAMRFLLAGEFDGRVRSAATGELSRLIELVNRVAVQLRQYDTVRALRTGYANRAMYMLLGRLTTPAMIVDLPRGTCRTNPACQRAFDISSATVSVEFILRQDANQHFAATLLEAFERDKREHNIACSLRLAPNAAARDVDVSFVPIKGDNDEVELGLVMLTIRAPLQVGRTIRPRV